MEVGGGNNYKLPHFNKAALRTQNRLPESITCEVTIKKA